MPEKLKIIAGIVLLQTIISCTNPFSTRTPERPAGNDQISVFEPAVTPRILMTNFSRSIEQKNLQEYLSVFQSDDSPPVSYLFEPDENYSELFTYPWRYEDELSYFSKLSQSDRFGYPHLRFHLMDSLVFSPLNPAAADDSVETNFVRYELKIESSDSVRILSGQSRFKLLKDSQSLELWFLYFWQDRAINSEPEKSWTAHRYELR